MAEFDVGTLDAGGNVSEERKLTLLRRQNMTADELEAEEEDDGVVIVAQRDLRDRGCAVLGRQG